MEKLTKDELLKYLKEGDKETRKNSLIAQKKMSMKKADAVSLGSYLVETKSDALKANVPFSKLPDSLKVRVIINTTNLMDSHGDVHMPGLWSKSLKENKSIMHLQEHEQGFKYIIADGAALKAYTQTFTWKELGHDMPGTTEALVFDSLVKDAGSDARNQFMYEQYAKGYVKNHSVGMQYVKLFMAVNEPNDPYFTAEYEAWLKYFPEVANKEAAIDTGYFWAVTEAKAIEGSAVVLGSNSITPTLDNNLKQSPDGTDENKTNEPTMSLTTELKEILKTKKLF